jgi:hypothetical protein
MVPTFKQDGYYPIYMNDARNVSIRHFILVEKEKDPEN